MRKQKEMQDSELILHKEISRRIDENGKEIVRIKKEIANGEVNLGSVQKPKNKDIIFVEYHTRNKRFNPFGF